MAAKFDAEKAAQVASMFIELNGGSINRYALIKMIYLADRYACEQWGTSMTGDSAVSMEHGPVLSCVYDLTKGKSRPDLAPWNDFITPADDQNIVTLKGTITDKDRLSKLDVKFINQAYQKLGKLNFTQLKKWSHELPEYKHVGKGEVEEINDATRLLAVGKTPECIKAVFQEEAEVNMVRAIWATP